LDFWFENIPSGNPDARLMRSVNGNYFSYSFNKSYQPGFDLTTHSYSLLGGRRRRYHKTTSPPGQWPEMFRENNENGLKIAKN
jgi:hypothetical protein